MKRLDTHLLACLDALIAEAHVSRAAYRMGMAQPAMSAMLARLRQIFGDPLLVRTQQGMVPTQRGLDAAEAARDALKLLEQALSGPKAPEPAQAQMEIRFVAVNSVAIAFLPRLVRRLHEEAPGMRLTIEPADIRRARELLETNECDFVIGFSSSVPSGLFASTLYRTRRRCIVREGHPAIRDSITLEQYVAHPHVVLGAGSLPVSAYEMEVEKALRARRLERRVGVRVSDPMISAAIVAETDYVATIGEALAIKFAAPLGLQVLPPPIPLRDHDILMMWHERTHREPTFRWLRALIRRIAGAESAAERSGEAWMPESPDEPPQGGEALLVDLHGHLDLDRHVEG